MEADTLSLEKVWDHQFVFPVTLTSTEPVMCLFMVLLHCHVHWSPHLGPLLSTQFQHLG